MIQSGNIYWERLEDIAKQVCKREKCFLYDIQFIPGSHGKGKVLRVFIDREDENIGIDDCVNVSRGLSLLLDVEDLVPGEGYKLEVSSPGVDRPLRQLWHFKKVLGSEIVLRTKTSILKEAQKCFNAKGLLIDVKDDKNIITININGRKCDVCIDDIIKAKVIFNFESQKKHNIKAR